MTSIYGKGPKGKATKLHAELVRARGACERCGTSNAKLETAHIIVRELNGDPDGIRLRTNEDNAWCLCHACHRRMHKFPDEHMDLVRRTIGEDLYYEFKRISNPTMHRAWRAGDWEAECVRLQSILDEVAA